MGLNGLNERMMDKQEIIRIILDESQRIKRTDKALLASKVNVHNVADRIVKACGILPVSDSEVAVCSVCNKMPVKNCDDCSYEIYGMNP